MVNLPSYVHLVSQVNNTGTAIELTTTNPGNIGNRDFYLFRCPLEVRKTVSGSPIPVTVGVNTVQVPLKNRFGLQIKSDKVPKRSKEGYYIIDNSGETPAPYVILMDTPRNIEDA